VILTSKSEEGSLARWLWSLWNEQQLEGEKWGQGKVGKVTELNQTVDLEVSSKPNSSNNKSQKSETKMKDK
jgi:cleavage and polyadenylation specificity factor subunit 2